MSEPRFYAEWNGQEYVVHDSEQQLDSAPKLDDVMKRIIGRELPGVEVTINDSGMIAVLSPAPEESELQAEVRRLQAQVTELQGANNREIERRRAAEGRLGPLHRRINELEKVCADVRECVVYNKGVIVREGGGPEDLAASVAVTMSKLKG